MSRFRFLFVSALFLACASPLSFASPEEVLTATQFEAARTRVKQKFVGLDSLVDAVMDQMKSWALYPETRIRPQVIFLAGPTSTGKTALVDTIIKELSLESGFLYFDMDRYSTVEASYHNFGNDLETLLGRKYGESDSYRIPNNLIFMLDEMQKVNTKLGSHTVPRPGISKLWEFLGNDGRISVANPRFEDLTQKIRSMEFNLVPLAMRAASDENAQKEHERLLEICDRYNAELQSLPKQITLDFKGALVFVAANIDHIFAGTRIFDPEVLTADQLHQLTAAVTPSDVKIGLGEIFRPEHVGRFGNRILPVPTLPEAAFRRLIDMRLGQIATLGLQNFRMQLQFSERFKQRIYDEGVIPSQGPRPLQTAIGTFAIDPLGTMFAKIASHSQYTSQAPALIVVDLANDENHATWRIDSGPLAGDETQFMIPIEYVRSRQLAPEPKRSITAARVAGSVTVYAGLKKSLPRWVRANSRASDRHGSIDFPVSLSIEDNQTRSELIDTIAVRLAPYVAETLIFGEPTLASMDEHQQISQSLITMVNYAGLGNSLLSVIHPLVQRSSTELENDYEQILALAKERARAVLVREHKFLSILAEKLTQTAELNRTQLTQLVKSTWTLNPEAEQIAVNQEPPSNCEQMLSRFIRNSGESIAEEVSLSVKKSKISF